MSNGKHLVSAINPEKEYRVSYLAPHQNKSRMYEYGAFDVLGKDLTEKQIVEINNKGWIGNKVKCDLCSYVWTAVYHEGCDKLECPNCNNLSYFESQT